MDKCVALTVVLALSTQIATAGRYLSNDGRDYHHGLDHVDPYKWYDGKRWEWEDAKGIPQKFHKPRQQDAGNNKFWHQHPDGWESDSDSWDYPDFSHHAEWHRNRPGQRNNYGNWNKQPSGNWNYGPPHHGPPHHGHHPNGNYWNQGGNNHQGSWNQGGSKPNWNQGGWNQNPDSNTPSQINPDWQIQQGGSNNNEPAPTWNQGSGNTWGQPTTTAASAATQAPLATALCIRSCPVTPEFNPVCGSNNVTYGNIGRLECAKYCGVDVTMRSKQPCTAANTQDFPPQPPNNTNVPIPDPTRFTTIDVPPITNPTPVDPNVDTTTSKFTIPQDILNSIFTSTQSTSLPGGVTDDDNYDIDIRTRNRNNFLNTQSQVYDLPPTS